MPRRRKLVVVDVLTEVRRCLRRLRRVEVYLAHQERQQAAVQRVQARARADAEMSESRR